MADRLIIWLSSPGGNLVWDVFLQALGIFITVVVIGRYLERREERRWLPARQFLYSRLFFKADYLVRFLPMHHWDNIGDVNYQFGHVGYIGKAFGWDFYNCLVELSDSEFEERVEQLAAGKPEISSFKQGLDETVGQSSTVFLGREPELNKLILELQNRLSGFIVALERYRRVAAEGRGRSLAFRHESYEQACIALKLLVIQAYLFRMWLAARADRVEPIA